MNPCISVASGKVAGPTDGFKPVARPAAAYKAPPPLDETYKYL